MTKKKIGVIAVAAVVAGTVFMTGFSVVSADEVESVLTGRERFVERVSELLGVNQTDLEEAMDTAHEELGDEYGHMGGGMMGRGMNGQNLIEEVAACTDLTVEEIRTVHADSELTLAEALAELGVDSISDVSSCLVVSLYEKADELEADGVDADRVVVMRDNAEDLVDNFLNAEPGERPLQGEFGGEMGRDMHRSGGNGSN